MKNILLLQEKNTVTNPNNAAYDKKLALKNNAAIFSRILKINNQLIENVEDLDIVMPMYNLFEYSKNYRKASGSLWNYYRDEPSSGAEGNINYSIKDSESFNYKKSITGKLEGTDVEKEDIKTAVPLKHLSNFIRTLKILLVNCEIIWT